VSASRAVPAAAPRERLVDRRPVVDAAQLVARFVPPRRFHGVRFATYAPSPAHPSQAAALAAVERFAADIAAASARPPTRWRWLRRATAATPAPAGPAGRYLDGGFGVGKTHLLAALFHAVTGPALYASLEELTAFIGYVGMDEAVQAAAGATLVCIDEFELDDPANTQMMRSFLDRVVAGGARVAATSNAVPDRLGAGRFNADHFRRELASIARHFDVVRIDGPDYRARSAMLAQPVAEHAVSARAAALPGRVAEDDVDALLGHLRELHSVQYGPLVDGLDGLVLHGLRPLCDQADALRFVYLVDELYDAEAALVASGCRVEEIFDASYRHGSYRKKYGRAESRLSALLREAVPVD
jgi:cell division protein ZapE